MEKDSAYRAANIRPEAQEQKQPQPYAEAQQEDQSLWSLHKESSMKKTNSFWIIGYLLIILATIFFNSCTKQDQEKVVWQNLDQTTTFFVSIDGSGSFEVVPGTTKIITHCCGQAMSIGLTAKVYQIVNDSDIYVRSITVVSKNYLFLSNK